MFKNFDDWLFESTVSYKTAIQGRKISDVDEEFAFSKLKTLQDLIKWEHDTWGGNDEENETFHREGIKTVEKYLKSTPENILYLTFQGQKMINQDEYVLGGPYLPELREFLQTHEAKKTDPAWTDTRNNANTMSYMKNNIRIVVVEGVKVIWWWGNQFETEHCWVNAQDLIKHCANKIEKEFLPSLAKWMTSEQKQKYRTNITSSRLKI